MVLDRNLNASNGVLLNESKVLTALLIEKLTAFETVESGYFTVFIRADN